MAVCSDCGRQFKVPLTSLKRTSDGQNVKPFKNLGKLCNFEQYAHSWDQ